MQYQLEADTRWIRRAAFTLDEMARALPPGHGHAAALAGGNLGSSAEAAAAAALIGLRGAQAYEASAQLRAVSSGLAARLRLAADALDRADEPVRGGYR